MSVEIEMTLKINFYITFLFLGILLRDSFALVFLIFYRNYIKIDQFDAFILFPDIDILLAHDNRWI